MGWGPVRFFFFVKITTKQIQPPNICSFGWGGGAKLTVDDFGFPWLELMDQTPGGKSNLFT